MGNNTSCVFCEDCYQCGRCQYCKQSKQCFDCIYCNNCEFCKHCYQCDSSKGLLFSNNISYYSYYNLRDFILKNEDLSKIYLSEIIEMFNYDNLDHSYLHPNVTGWKYINENGLKYIEISYLINESKSEIKNYKLFINNVTLSYKFLINYKEIVDFLIKCKKFPPSILPVF